MPPPRTFSNPLVAELTNANRISIMNSKKLDLGNFQTSLGILKRWRRGESNPCPERHQQWYLHVYPAVWDFGLVRPAGSVTSPIHLWISA